MIDRSRLLKNVSWLGGARVMRILQLVAREHRSPWKGGLAALYTPFFTRYGRIHCDAWSADFILGTSPIKRRRGGHHQTSADTHRRLLRFNGCCSFHQTPIDLLAMMFFIMLLTAIITLAHRIYLMKRTCEARRCHGHGTHLLYADSRRRRLADG